MRLPDICSSSRTGAGIKRDSTYRLGFVVVEYRWHPLYGKRLRLSRRTHHDGVAVVHVDDSGNVSRELPSWMVDASSCREMELGPPLISLAGLNELREVIGFGKDAANRGPRSVSSLVKESEPDEATEKTIQPPAGFIAGARNNDSIEPEGTRRNDQDSRRSTAGSSRRISKRVSGSQK